MTSKTTKAEKREYWCCAYVLHPDKETTIEEIEIVMKNIENFLGTQWDYDAERTFEDKENFIDVHNWTDELESQITEFIKGKYFSYRITDESLGGCESCSQG